MNAIKFIEEKRRMCSVYGHCGVCPAFRHKSYCIFSTEYGEPPLEQIKFLEKWLEKHPRNTRQSVFLERYSEAEIINDVRHGRWLTWEEQFPESTPKKKNNLGVFCDKCHNHADNQTDYCPNCGAKMDEVNNGKENQ